MTRTGTWIHQQQLDLLAAKNEVVIHQVSTSSAVVILRVSTNRKSHLNLMVISVTRRHATQTTRNTLITRERTKSPTKSPTKSRTKSPTKSRKTSRKNTTRTTHG